jgi:hypothetical protein
MIQILEFIFQDFLHWLGTFLLLGIIFGLLRGIVYIDRRTINNEKDTQNEKDD